jgi:Zn-dependent protease
VGYAKPVPVRFDHLRNPRIDMIWVALAGPGSNFIQAIFWAVFWILIQGFGINEPFLISMAKAGIFWNIGLLVFNLFPLPPLDGGRILAGILPYRQAVMFGKLEPWGFFIVLGLLFTGVISQWWMVPLSDFFIAIVRTLTSPLRMVFTP